MSCKKIAFFGLATLGLTFSAAHFAQATLCEKEKEALTFLEKQSTLDSDTFESFLNLANHSQYQLSFEQPFQDVKKLKKKEESDRALIHYLYERGYIKQNFSVQPQGFLDELREKEALVAELRNCIEVQHTLLNQLLRKNPAYPNLEETVSNQQNQMLFKGILAREVQLKVILEYISLTHKLEQDLDWILSWASENQSEVVQIFEKVLARVDLSDSETKSFQMMQSRWLGTAEAALTQLQLALKELQDDQVPLTEENLFKCRSLALDPIFRLRKLSQSRQIQFEFTNLLLRRLSGSRIPFGDLEKRIALSVKKAALENQTLSTILTDQWKDLAFEDFLASTPFIGENLGWSLEVIGKYRASNYIDRALNRILSRNDLTPENLQTLYLWAKSKNLFFYVWKNIALHSACSSELHQEMLKALEDWKDPNPFPFQNYSKHAQRKDLKKWLKLKLKKAR